VRRLFVVALIGAVGCVAGCSSSGGKAVAPQTNDGPALTVLAIGGSATEGDGIPNRLHDAWPYRVFHDAFGRATTFVNGAIDDATVANALSLQVPLAAELKPDVVEVWLGADDIVSGTSTAAFESGLASVVDALHADGAKRVLVADLPAAYGARVPAFNDAIHRVVKRTGADLVPLASARIKLTTGGGTAEPDTASHAAIAAAFGRQLQRP
jgi:lysophospholipase L1-like esterase